MPIQNLDCFFSMAKQHVVCQDYALSGMLPHPFAILCDGCSSSKHSDVGARILAMSAKKFLAAHYSKADTSLPSYREAGLAIIRTARAAAELLELERSCLDATLLLAFPVEGEIQVYVYGDGYIAAVDNSGELSYARISFRENMPYYLSYWTDEKRHSLYLRHNHLGRDVLVQDRFTGAEQESGTLQYDAPLGFVFSQQDYSLVALLSDGLASLSSIAENRMIPEREVLEQLMAYKTTKGDFVQRRTKRLIKNYTKQDIYPTDDLSVAAMLLQ